MAIKIIFETSIISLKELDLVTLRPGLGRVRRSLTVTCGEAGPAKNRNLFVLWTV